MSTETRPEATEPTTWNYHGTKIQARFISQDEKYITAEVQNPDGEKIALSFRKSTMVEDSDA